MQVRSPGSENCLLYEEIQSINMSGSSGVFAVTLNDGSGTRLDTPTYQVDRIFANRDSMVLDSTRCSVGTSYAPNSGDGRKFVVYFKDENMTAYEPLPIMSLNYAPQAMYALESQKIDKFPVNTLLRAVDGSGNPATAPALDPTQLTNLNNLLAGTSTQYATSTAFNTVQTFAKSAPPTCSVGEVLKSNGTTLSCVSPTASASYSGITAATATNTIDNLNFSQNWNWSTATTQSPMNMSANAITTGSLMSVATSSASLNSTNGLINVANTGASTAGILARFQSNSTVGSGLTVLTNGNVGVGTAIPQAGLDIATTGTSGSAIIVPRDTTGNRPSTPINGMVRYNTTLNKIEAYEAGAWTGFATNSTTTGAAMIGGNATAGAMVLGTNTSQSLVLMTNGSWGTEIDSSGHIGIGTSPVSTEQLAVSGTVQIVGLTQNAGGGSLTVNTGGANIGITDTSTGLFTSSGANGSAGTTRHGVKSTVTATGATSTNIGGYFSATGATNNYGLIVASGNVGIGTSAPSSQLHVLSSSGNSKLIQDTFVSGVPYFVGRNAGGTSAAPTNTSSGNTLATFGGIGHDGTSYSLFPNADISFVSAQPFSGAAKGTYMTFSTTSTGSTTNSERMRISASGNVGIGATSPQTTLQVAGVISPATNNTYTLGSAAYRFTEVYATNGVINTSDRREKKDIYNTDLGLDFINKLRPVSYRWNTGVDSDIHYGLIAQEAEQAIAEVGKTEKTSIVTHDETTDRYGVRYSELISPIIKAVQELYLRILGIDREIASVKVEKADKTEVEAKFQKLESENEKLKQENAAKAQEMAELKAYLCAQDKKATICK